jgi:hypothetical protein
MNFFDTYLTNVIFVDYITKLKKNSIHKLPIIDKLILSFEYKKPTLKKVLLSLITLKLINGNINRKGKIILTKRSNIA